MTNLSKKAHFKKNSPLGKLKVQICKYYILFCEYINITNKKAKKHSQKPFKNGGVQHFFTKNS